MSVIKLTLPPGEMPVHGKQVSFKAPCDCGSTRAIQLDGVSYSICNALGRVVTGAHGLWEAGEIISIILDMENNKALIQNAAALSREEVFDVTIPLAWKADSKNGGYYQTVVVEGIFESDHPYADVSLGTDVDANQAYLDAWAEVTTVTTTDDSVTIRANKKAPVSAFTMRLKVVR